MPGLIVIGYDGSTDAKRAIAAAGHLRADRALVVNVWQPPVQTAATSRGTAAVLPGSADERQVEAAARRTPEDGSARARDAGLAADAAILCEASAKDIGCAVATVARERDADAIVVGRRGVSRPESVVLGSVSDAIVREAHCPVLVVPAADDD